MSDNRIVKIQSILDSQIPEFISSESPLFKEFLTQYYISQTHKTGVVDIANSLSDYKNISSISSENIHSSNQTCFLIEDIYPYDDVIEVNTSVGFPDKYGLFQIDEEIITYTDIIKENNTVKFIGCVRGFSGITNIDYTRDSSGLVFSTSNVNEHKSGSVVKNLNLIFYQKLFEKFKYHYLPDFENRDFSNKTDLELILSRARDFYLTKGTDVSFKILFEILYNDAITVIKPQEYMIRLSEDDNIITKNVLVEPIFGEFNPPDLIGETIFQNISEGVVASAAIYNVEYRPADNYILYEISLDLESFIYNFNSTKKTIVLEKLPTSLIVDSTIGFPEEGVVYVKSKNPDLTTRILSLKYSGKTINQFLNISDITQLEYASISSEDEIIENNLIYVTSSEGNVVQFRLLNVIETFDYSNVNTMKVNDTFFLSSFGENLTDMPEFTSWIYNYPTYHDIKSVDSSIIELKDAVDFVIGEEVDLIDSNNNVEAVTIVDIISNNKIQINDNSGRIRTRLNKKIAKNTYNLNDCINIQNTYLNKNNNSVVVATSGLPLNINLESLNTITFSVVGIGTIFTTKSLDGTTSINHNLLSGNKIFINSTNTGITTGQYFVKKIDENKISLYQSTSDLYLSFLNSSDVSSPITITESSINNIIGIATNNEYNGFNNDFKNQLLLKEFKVEDSLIRNKTNSSSPIYNIEQAYSAFS